jgi:signal transduction histidine kinase
MWEYDDRQQVLGRDVVDLWQSGDWASAMMQALEEIGGWVGKLVARRKNGSTFSVLVSASMVEDDAGKPIRMMGSFVDMTHRERANEMLRRHVERLGVLHDIDSAILAARSAEEIAHAALRHIQRLLPCQRASVILFDLEADEFIVLAVQSSGVTTVETEGTRLPLEGLEEQFKTLRQGKVCLIDDVWSFSTLPAAVQVLQPEGLRSCLAVPLCPQGELIGSLVLWAERVGALGQEHLPIAQEIANSLAIAIQHARLCESLIQQRERLRTLTARLAEAEDAERRQIAQVLHDEIGQNLTALGLNLNLVQTQMDQDASQPILARLDDSLALVEKTTERVRHVMADLRPPMLDDYGLIPTLRWYGEQFTSRTGVSVTVQGEEPIPRLATQIENAFCRITQEALTNVAKHARASQVTITITAADQIARLVVADDGGGFDRAQLTPPDEARGWGLLTMTERAEAIGAQCRIESHPQQGTRVIVEAVR